MAETVRIQRPKSDFSEERFRILFEQSPVSTQIFAPDGTMVTANGAWERLWGVTVEQLAGYNILRDAQLVAKDVMPYIQKAFAGEAAAIPPICYEPEQTIPGLSDVPYRWVSASIYPLKSADDTVSEVVLMHEDITDRVEAEQALRESERRFRAIFDGAPIGISLVDADGRYVAVNTVRQEMLGYSEAELLGRRYEDLTHPDDIQHDLEVNARAQAVQQDHFDLEKRFIRKDGTAVWARITVAVVRDEAGNPQYSISLAEDITQRKESEAAVSRLLEREREARSSVERLAAEREAILGQLGEGIVIADPEGNITFLNEAARCIAGIDTVGVPPQEQADTYNILTMDGRPYSVLDDPGIVRAALYGEAASNLMWRIVRPDGTEVIAQGSAVPVVADDGTRLGAVLTMRDVTVQYMLERQKEDFLSAVAHDLRTPLTTIKGRVQLLQRRAFDSPPLDRDILSDDLARVDRSVTRMMTLINELLDVANIQIGRSLTLQTRPTDLVTLARGVAKEYQPATDRHTIIVQTAVPELVGEWDATRLERVLSNLISNAVKYSPDGGNIVVEVGEERQEDRDWAVLRVSDRGIGIPEADLATIFTRFHRAANVAGKIPGTGIGLAAVREIVEHHGGKVSVASREGAGSTFTVLLPR